jgi:hypothetical protein
MLFRPGSKGEHIHGTSHAPASNSLPAGAAISRGHEELASTARKAKRPPAEALAANGPIFPPAMSAPWPGARAPQLRPTGFAT